MSIFFANKMQHVIKTYSIAALFSLFYVIYSY